MRGKRMLFPLFPYTFFTFSHVKTVKKWEKTHFPREKMGLDPPTASIRTYIWRCLVVIAIKSCFGNTFSIRDKSLSDEGNSMLLLQVLFTLKNVYY